jgi:hAT family C-terminal dimerisation region
MFDVMLDMASTSSPTSSHPNADAELQEYLATPVDPSARDALKWWYDHRFRFPRVSRMARDYLAIPPTSVEVERVFSRGRILLSHLRNRMSPQTTRKMMCLNSWFKVNIIKTDDALSAIRQAPDVVEDSDDEIGGGWDGVLLEGLD